jgi:hypothetical protein
LVVDRVLFGEHIRIVLPFVKYHETMFAMTGWSPEEVYASAMNILKAKARPTGHYLLQRHGGSERLSRGP